MNINGKKLKLRRIELDITQRRLSKECDIAIGTISGIEKHNKSTSTRILTKIAEALCVDLNYFFGC